MQPTKALLNSISSTSDDCIEIEIRDSVDMNRAGTRTGATDGISVLCLERLESSAAAPVEKELPVSADNTTS